MTEPENEIALLHELITTAKRKLPQGTWNYVVGGAESETTLRRNRQALDSLAFRPRVLRDVMEQVSPAGPIYQAGTLSGNPLAVAAGRAALDAIYQDPGFFENLESTTHTLGEGLESAAKAAGIDLRVQRVGSMGCGYFTSAPVRNFDEASATDTDRFYRFHKEMLERGVYLAPSPYEAFFVSAAHGPEQIQATIEAAKESFAAVA